MKPILFLILLSGLICTSVAKAEQTASFPEETPVVDIRFPADWDVAEEDGVLIAHPGEDALFFISLAELESKTNKAALAEVKAEIEESFEDVTYDEPQTTVKDDLNLMLINAKGTDEDDEKVNINLILISRKDSKTLLVLTFISTEESFEKYGKLGSEVINSITAYTEDAEEEAEEEEEAENQTFSYPNAKQPDFAIDFPADWVMKANEDEGVYVESPDKLVAANVIMVPKAEIAEAEKHLKQSVGERFKEIVWNQGKDPEVNKDEDLGLTATFHNAVASDGEGTEAYSINMVIYSRKKGDVAMILLVQNPQRAIEKHVDNMTAILRSIKVR